MKLFMLMSLKPKLKALSTSTSKRAVPTEAAQVLGLNLLTNAPDLRTDLDMEEAIAGIEAMMTVEGTDGVVEVVALTSGLEADLIMGMEEAAVVTVEVVEEGTMTEGIIVEEAEVMVW